MAMRVELRGAVAANSSPPPCGEGSGVGVGECGTALPIWHDPPPHPSPTRGEGVVARLAPALCAAALVIAITTAASAQGALPPGEGRDLLAAACSQCHPLNVVRSMREGGEGWKRHVYNMVTRGAQLNAHEADMVVAYLAANFGPTTPATSAISVALPSGPGKELVEARCTACHDLERVASAKRQKSEWPALVANMVGRGAVATPDEAQAISTYLAAHFAGE
jgi:cytochrome c5